MIGTPLHGVIAYPVTPFHDPAAPLAGAPDLPTLRRLIDDLVDSGAQAVAPLGSTGEAAYLTDAEWDSVCETALDAVGGRVPTLVGVGHVSTSETARRARVAARHGATTVMVLPAAYWRLTRQETERHFASVADAAGVPVMLYNNPATSGTDLTPAEIVSLGARIENLTMVKESSGHVERFREILDRSDGTLTVYNGSNPIALEALRAGAAGWCTAAPGLVPGGPRTLYEAHTAGDIGRADAVLAELLPLLRFIVDRGLPRAVKNGLELLGRPAGAPRPPLAPLTGDDTELLASLLKDLAPYT
ncbi:dihydrodipicolinate synthase family protein [Streptomyces sp. NPDC059247]|uniref:dihydrodipicolinate synthase family protein n=1 Tax=Streptomyces sp. NPDC059247 TaxID=3346790 RepID=UPI00369FBA00